MLTVPSLRPYLVPKILSPASPRPGRAVTRDGLRLARDAGFRGISLPLDQPLDLAELVEGLKRGEIVDVKMEHLVTHLAQHGVVQLEEAHLHAAVWGFRHEGAVAHLVGVLALFQLVEEGVGQLYNALGHSGKACHMDTETVLAASALQPAQEDDPSIGLAHAYIIILYAGEAVFHLVVIHIYFGDRNRLEKIVLLSFI